MTTAPALSATGHAWHSQSAQDVLARLGSSAAGLSAQEAAKRLAVDGRNELKEGKRLSLLWMFFGQFKSLIIWILIAAGILFGVLGDIVDTVAIFAIVVLNAAIGLYQQFKAEKSIEALNKMTAPHAKVHRDEQVISIPAAGVVVGDILTLEAGDVVAADARLLAAASLKSIESALTGESEAVTKESATLQPGELSLGDRDNRIASLIEEAGGDDETPLQRKLDSFGRILVWAALGIVALLFGIGLLRGTELLELLKTSVGLAVAAVPEGLPAVVTVALSLGVLRMARRRALMRKLAAVETLGSTSVICTDKTGTLTVGDPIDSDVMKRAPRRRSERITNHGFLWTMAFTGCLTAGVALAVYLYVLRTGSLETARTSAFTVLVFAELLRSFGARSETKAVWRISLVSNVSLVVVVAVSFALQVWSQHDAMLGRFLRTSSILLTDCLVLAAVGAIPLLVLELLKMLRQRRGHRRTESPGHATAT